MIISILTLFPEIFKNVFSSSIIGRAQKNKSVEIRLVNIRDFATDKHKSVDDKPYGGGVGMVMRVDIVERAIANSKIPASPAGRQIPNSKFKQKVVLLDPKGKTFNQAKARSFSLLDHLILVCGHYEGVDERITHFVDEKVSIGEFVLTGGEIPAMTITDATVRLIAGVLTKKEAVLFESFGKERYLEEPHFTRPPVYKGIKVPSALLSGDHKKIADWRKNKRQLLK